MQTPEEHLTGITNIWEMLKTKQFHSANVSVRGFAELPDASSAKTSHSINRI